jgi:hypothetical protein
VNAVDVVGLLASVRPSRHETVGDGVEVGDGDHWVEVGGELEVVVGGEVEVCCEVDVDREVEVGGEVEIYREVGVDSGVEVDKELPGWLELLLVSPPPFELS